MKYLLNFLLVLFLANSAWAEEFNFSLGDLSTCQSRTASMPFKSQYVDFRHNDTTQLFTFEAKFSNQNGAPLPDVLHFVTAPDSQQFYYAGHFANVFIDATTLSNVKVTGYAFNGLITQLTSGFISNACNIGFKHSFTTRDSAANPQPAAAPLFSSTELSTKDVIQHVSVTDEIIGSITYRTFELVLDINQIANPNYTCRDIQHQNAPSCQWTNLKTYRTSPGNPDRAGFALFLSSGSTTNYSGHYLNQLNWNNCSACLNTAVFTNRSPVCSSINFSNASTAPGQSTIVTAKFFDLDNDAQTINVVNLPSGATSNPSSGQTVNLNSNNTDVVINWTPRLGQEGSFPITVLASQNYGGNKATASCNFSIQVDSLGQFTNSCIATNLSSAKSESEQKVIQLRKTANQIFQKLNRSQGVNTRERSLRKNYINYANQLLNKNNGYLISIPNFGYRGTCPEYCPQNLNITRARIDANEAAFQMRVHSQRLGRAATRFYRSKGQLNDARIANRQTRQLVNIQTAIQSILTEQVPSELFNCQF